MLIEYMKCDRSGYIAVEEVIYLLIQVLNHP